MRVSIVIATHQRPARLARLLHSLATQVITGQHELLIAENGTAMASPIDCAGLNPIHLHQPQPGKCRIQNRALAQAHGEVIVFLDDDIVAAPNYIAAVEDFFGGHCEYAAMKGRILPEEDPYSRAGALAPYLDLPLVDHGEQVCEVRGVMGANMAFRAAALSVVGGFDERLGPGAAGHEEETEMSHRLRAAGFRIGYAPAAFIWHEVEPQRAERARFIRVACERGYCRTLHERHSRREVALKLAIASIRLTVARSLSAPIERLAREERRLAVAQGMWQGLKDRGAHHRNY